MAVKNHRINLADSELVILINRGDQRAFDELFLRHKEALYIHAYRMVADHELCNDIIQEVFLAVWERRKQWQIQTTPLAYLYRAVRNKILDHISHEQVVTRYMAEMVDFDENGQNFTDDYILEKELLALIEEIKNDLPKRTREIFDLNKTEELSYRDIAQKLDISEHTAKKQVHNALRYLRTRLSSGIFFIFFHIFFQL
ncbi:RNA polymerase sigma factor [Sphingobacterium griseoflavum]|uniref:DNA-directed RNA polymerase sigma-70 factor n=1 Tax=Sphingobacterium griseoflavum TaxID=1474952 RepID=A0ABQ3HS28_9SPHI|nr:RNA polymerase sigma-70 factor [Sphingobacterium griseoflavum]GHE28683.1 DNA-directed RNA polymerase sigma-70 factor [Sphingobacterium griseoflavum]